LFYNVGVGEGVDLRQFHHVICREWSSASHVMILTTLQAKIASCIIFDTKDHAKRIAAMSLDMREPSKRSYPILQIVYD
jgi:hypothetical protein